MFKNIAAGLRPGNPLKDGSRACFQMDAGSLRQLAADRALYTREILVQNDFYGHATILKNYTQIPPKQSIKAAIEHGPFFGGFVWDADINSPVPALLVPGEFRFPVLKRRTDKKLYGIGPILAYAPGLLDEQALNSEKKRSGKTLLAFPAHSTHHVDAHFDLDEYCRFLGETGRGFDTIRVCLYWKDVLRGWAGEFIARGFECVTAGHIFDPLFLPRLKSIIECATVTTSNALGTHVGYSVFLGKPHFLAAQKVERTARAEAIVKRDAPDRSDQPDVLEIVKAFSEWREQISPQQKEVVQRYWGTNEVKSVSELRAILFETEEMYRARRRVLLRFKDNCGWLVR